MGTRFQVLGTVRTWVDDRPVDVGPARQRCVLVVLLMAANQPLSVDQLVDRVWGDRGTHRTRKTVHVYLHRLRRVLAHAPGVRIPRTPGGYALEVEPGAVDAHRFRELVATARGADPDTEAPVLWEQALGLWRGEAFADLDSPWLTEVRAELDRQRFAAELDHVDSLLRQGRHAEALPDLAGRVARHPLDERLAGQYLLALYRSGRQAEAINHYHHLRNRLAEDLGSDPSPPLAQLYQQVLAGDPTLEQPVTLQPRSRPPVPRQLPVPPRAFTGRTAELAALDAAGGNGAEPGAAPVVFTISGAAGTGKTWLALHWAHRNLDRFPDGQLFTNLHGFGPDDHPAPPETALRGFLDALGVSPTAIPQHLDAQAALFRSLVAGKRMLVLLDNARDAEQVVPLLPGTPTCTVVITSRTRLSHLVTAYGAEPVPVDVLPDPDARQVLADRLGEPRLAAEPEATAEILARCGGLPLALGIVAGRLRCHPTLSLAAVAGELHESDHCLEALDATDPAASLPAVLSWSHAALPDDQARVFFLLSLAPGPDIGLLAAAALTDLPPSRCRFLLRGLEESNLVQQHAPGRYRMHDLTRLHTAEHARRHLPEDARAAALRRVVDHYLHTAVAAISVVTPQMPPSGPAAPATAPHAHPLPDADAALAWLSSEHPCLLAAQRLAAELGRHEVAWQFAWSLDAFLSRQGHLRQRVTAWQVASAASRHVSGTVTSCRTYRNLGHALAHLGEHDRALRLLRDALALADDAEDPLEQYTTHNALAVAWERVGDHRRALQHATAASRFADLLGDPARKADALNARGWYEARLGNYAVARSLCTAALRLWRRTADRGGEANTLDSLGYIARRTGDHQRALEHYRRAADLFARVGATYHEAGVLEELGHVHLELGRHTHTRTTWLRALTLFLAQHRTADANRVRDGLAAIPPVLREGVREEVRS